MILISTPLSDKCVAKPCLKVLQEIFFFIPAFLVAFFTIICAVLIEMCFCGFTLLWNNHFQYLLILKILLSPSRLASISSFSFSNESIESVK